MTTPTKPKPRTIAVQRTCEICEGDGYREIGLDFIGQSRTTYCVRCGGTGFVEFERKVECP